jgi:para-nitrobenzyl esterase
MFANLAARKAKRLKSTGGAHVKSKSQSPNLATQNTPPQNPTRRAAIKTAATLLGAGAVSTATILSPAPAKATSASANPAPPPTTPIIANDSNAIVDTTSGKVRGYTSSGILTFKGIPYAEPTEGKLRFLPPVKRKPWTGVRSSMQFGYVCPQGPRAGWAFDENAWMFSWDDGIPNEDCLRINLWTPASDNKKRPVMVWLHGGGFQAGSGQELKSYDGERLSRRGDVVVVSLNHRIGVLGHLNLAAYGDQYAASANLGQLDLVAALEWVRDNISNFGGDPGNVTIFGQSGGGGKVSTLMAMPSAKGLFHRAIVQSGSMDRGATVEHSSQVAAELLDELGLNKSQVAQLHELTSQKLVDAGLAIQRKHPRNGLPDVRKMADLLLWAPVVDGTVLPRHPFAPDGPPISAQVPMMVGTVLNEFLNGIDHPEYESMTDAEVKERVTKMFGDKSTKVIEAFRQAHPKEKPFDILSRIAAANVRQGAVTQCERKAAQSAAPAYLYWFTWKTPLLDARPRAFHCAELAFCFDNTARCENMTGDSPEARKLAAQVSEAWIHFARTGNPNHAGIPTWPAFTADKCETMIFDGPCEMKLNPDTAERNSIEA